MRLSNNVEQRGRMRLLMRKNISLAMVALLALGLSGLVLAQDNGGSTASVQFVVVRDTDGKPVRNAQVVLHPVQRKGKQESGEIDL